LGNQTSIYLYEHIRVELDKIQEETKQSRSSLVNEALKQFIDKRTKES